MTDKTNAPAKPMANPAPVVETSNKGSGNRKNAAIGAAVGIGSAAIVAALLYTRRK